MRALLRKLGPTAVRTSVALACVALVCVAAAVAGCFGGKAGQVAADQVVTAGDGACRWSGPAPSPGSQQFTVRNEEGQPVRLTLADSSNGAVWAQSGTVAPETTHSVAAVLPSGSFHWRCVPLRGVSTVSAVRRTSGDGDGAEPGQPLRPLTPDEANYAVTQYRAAITEGITLLGQHTDALAAAVTTGNDDGARALWLTAHLDYERLGAAYGTFGDLDGVIDGLPGGLPGGADDPDFTGFLRVEHDLWGGADAALLAVDTQRLVDAVRRLVNGFPGMSTPPADLPLRAHEILEMTLQRELSGRSDLGSHTGLATARANLDGTETVLGVLTMPMQKRDPDLLAGARSAIERLTHALDGLRGPDGRWPALSELSTSQHEQLDAAMGAVVERLAPIPDVLQMPPSTNVD